MALNDDQRLRLELIIEGTREFPEEVNDWETGFVSSFTERYKEWGDSITVSPKQWAILDRIHDKVVLAGEGR